MSKPKLQVGSRVIAVVDNELVSRVLLKGSSVPELQELANFVFFYCLLHGLVLFVL